MPPPEDAKASVGESRSAQRAAVALNFGEARAVGDVTRLSRLSSGWSLKSWNLTVDFWYRESYMYVHFSFSWIVGFWKLSICVLFWPGLLTSWVSDGSCSGAGCEGTGRAQEVSQSHGEASQWALRLLMLALVGHLAGRLRELFKGSRFLIMPGVGHFPTNPKICQLQWLAAHGPCLWFCWFQVHEFTEANSCSILDWEYLHASHGLALFLLCAATIGTRMIHYLKLKQNTCRSAIAMHIAGGEGLSKIGWIDCKLRDAPEI